jgi:hypothetical protein
VCLVEVEGAPVLSPPVGLELELCGTESFGDLGKIRSWKATAVIQMLEKQMGPEPFRKVFPCFTWLESFPDSSIQGILVVVHNSISNSALFLCAIFTDCQQAIHMQ